MSWTKGVHIYNWFQFWLRKRLWWKLWFKKSNKMKTRLEVGRFLTRKLFYFKVSVVFLVFFKISGKKSENYIFMLQWNIQMVSFGVSWGKMLADWFWNGSDDRHIFLPFADIRVDMCADFWLIFIMGHDSWPIFQSWITSLVLELLILLVGSFSLELL